MNVKRCSSSVVYWWCFVVLIGASPWVQVVWGMVATNHKHAPTTTTTTTSNTLSSDPITLSRRGFGLQGVAVAVSGFVSSVVVAVPTTTRSVAVAAETVGKDPNCNDPNCLGVWDGLLADCPHSSSGPMIRTTTSSCVSSQDDTPGIFAEPWDYADSVSTHSNNNDVWTEQMRLLVAAIQLVASKRGDQATVVLQEGRYLRVLFQDGRSGERFMGEFYFTPQDTTVQFRIAASSSKNNVMEWSEAIRKQARFLKLPVLRNRQRTFWFGESEWDTFGPTGSAALGPPAEMRTGELEGRFSDVEDPHRRRSMDLLQQFPLPP